MSPPLFSRTLIDSVIFTPINGDSIPNLESIRDSINDPACDWRVLQDDISVNQILLIAPPLGSPIQDDRLCFVGDKTDLEVNDAQMYIGSANGSNIYVCAADNVGSVNSITPAMLTSTTPIFKNGQTGFCCVCTDSRGLNITHIAVSNEGIDILMTQGGATDASIMNYGRIGFDDQDSLFRVLLVSGSGSVSGGFWSSSSQGYITASNANSTNSPVNLVLNGSTTSECERETLFRTLESPNSLRMEGSGKAARATVSLRSLDTGFTKCLLRQMYAGQRSSGIMQENTGMGGSVLSISVPVSTSTISDTLYLTENL